MTTARQDLITLGTSGCLHLVNERAVLVCMAYVDLNPIRAGLTERVEQSDFTSIQQRLADASETRTTLTEPMGPIGFLEPSVGAGQCHRQALAAGAAHCASDLHYNLADLRAASC